MKEIKKVILDFFSENGQGSSKRWIAISTAAVLMWILVYSILKASNASERFSIIIATMVFILVLLGLATLPQIVELFRGGNSNNNKTP